MARFAIAQRVRAVHGPGRALQPERKNIGRVGRVLQVHPVQSAEPHYIVAFGDDTDTIDESCLEIHHAS